MEERPPVAPANRVWGEDRDTNGGKIRGHRRRPSDHPRSPSLFSLSPPLDHHGGCGGQVVRPIMPMILRRRSTCAGGRPPPPPPPVEPKWSKGRPSIDGRGAAFYQNLQQRFVFWPCKPFRRIEAFFLRASRGGERWPAGSIKNSFNSTLEF